MISFRAAATAHVNFDPSLVCDRPSGVVEGDVMVAFINSDTASQALTLPSGWTLTEDTATSGSELRGFAAWKVAGASEPSSYTFAFDSSVDAAVVIVAYSGVDTTAPVDVADSTLDTSKTSTAVAPSVTTTVDDARVVVAGMAEASTTVSTPSGTTSRGAVESVSGVAASMRVADFDQETAGATGTKDFTLGTSPQWVGVTVALAPGNNPPTAPSDLNPDSATVDRTSAQVFSWTFNDPDAGDSQSAYELQYRLEGDSTWTTTGQVSSPTSQHEFAALDFAAGDYEWQVRTWDAGGTEGPWSSSAFFTAATAPTPPSITDPANGSTVETDPHDVTWSTPNQDAYQLRRVADDAGSPDETTVYFDTGTVSSASTRTRSVDFPDNNQFEHIQVRVHYDGLWSTWTSVRVEVSYTPPAEPTLTVTPDDPAGAISVQATHPTPSASEPSVESVDFYRRDTDDTGDGIRIAAEVAPSAVYTDWHVAHLQEVAYRAKARGTNGTSTWSPWTS